MKISRILKYAAAVLLFAAFLLPGAFASAEKAKNNVLVYMVASDLETLDMAATKDIQEMSRAAENFGEETNLIVYAGGAEKWHNDIFSPEENRCVRFGRNGAETLFAENPRDMTNPQTLADFLRFCSEKYPAERNILILWNHGGGYKGFGADELNDYDKPMTPAGILQALEMSGMYFDIIGFDACMMANVITASCIVKNADYMVASEEMEPIGGWDYENWLTALAKDPQADTFSVCKNIADSYIRSGSVTADNTKLTLSVIDLNLMDRIVPQALRAFTEEMLGNLKTGTYDMVTVQKTLLSGMKQANRVDMIDTIAFLETLENKTAKELEQAIRSCIVYNRKFPEELNMNGIMIHLGVNMDNILGISVKDIEYLRTVGIDENYLNWLSFIRRYMDVANDMHRKERTLMDILMSAEKSSYDDVIYSAVRETMLDISDCYMTEDDSSMPQLVMPEEKKRLVLHISKNLFKEIGEKKVIFGTSFFEPEDFPMKYGSSYGQATRNDWLVHINDIPCPFFLEEETTSPSGEIIVYGYTKMNCSGKEGALFIRFIHNEASGWLSVEPIAFQKIDFSKEDLQFSRVEPTLHLKAEEPVFFFSTYLDEQGNEKTIRLSEEMTWGDVTRFELKGVKDPGSISAAYFVTDLFGIMYPLEIK